MDMRISLYILTFCILIVSFGFLGYIFFGYPLIILGISKLAQKPVGKSVFYPNVTIVIPAFNEETVIKEKIENTLSLDYPTEKLEILICDDASNDQTGEIAATFARKGIIITKSSTRKGKVGGINRAITLAKGEIFVISDADILANSDALSELIFNFSDSEVGCVIAETRMMPKDNNASESGGLYWKYEALIRQSESRLHSTVAATGHFMGIRKKVLHQIPENIILDDFYLAITTIQKGYRTISDSKAIVWERPTMSMKDEINRRRRLTAGRYQILGMGDKYLSKLPGLIKFQLISHKFLRLAIPYFMILGLVSNLLLVVDVKSWQLLSLTSIEQIVRFTLLIQLFFYFMAITGAFISKTKPIMGKLAKIWTIPYYLCATNFASLYGLFWYLSGKRTVLWQQATRK